MQNWKEHVPTGSVNEATGVCFRLLSSWCKHEEQGETITHTGAQASNTDKCIMVEGPSVPK